MLKDEFLRILNKKLELINEEERKDIIDEYRTHIEMKMEEGLTEAQAIEDFGDIDELVNEILEAYKINTKHVNESFDRKLNNFMDDIFISFKKMMGSFTNLDGDDIIRFIFDIIMILIVLLILKIPMSIFSSLGSSLLSGIIGFGIGHAIGILWELIIGIAYIIIFIVSMYSLFTRRLYYYHHKEEFREPNNVFDDVKETFHFDSKKNKTHNKAEDANSQAQAHEKSTTQKEDVSEVNTQEKQIKPIIGRNKNSSGSHIISSFIVIIARIFYCCTIIPCIFILIGLAITLGIMIIMSINGFTLFGAYFLVGGSFIVMGAIMSVLYRILWRNKTI